MGRILAALIAGIVFGLGLVISQMTNPEKVLAFLDIFGNWDPSLSFVMGGAVITTTLGYHIVLKRPKPIADSEFHLPQKTTLDRRLIIGAVLFGIGWGLVGLCPGPAIAALSFGGMPILVFFAAMAAGMVVFEGFSRTNG